MGKCIYCNKKAKLFKNIFLKILLIVIFIGNSHQIFSQQLVENYVDEFTNNKIKRTSWTSINNMLRFTAYFRISRINDNYYFDLKLMIGTSVFSIEKDQELMFKLSNGEVIKLLNTQYAITCTGCGAKGFLGSQAQGIHTSYYFTNEQIKKLKEIPAIKIRIYTSKGYVEDNIKPKYYKKLQTALFLVE